MTIELSSRDIATVLAALRVWQSDMIRGEAHTDMEHFDDGTTPLSADEIDALCERINFGD